MAEKRRKESVVWKYFTKDKENEDVATCTICQEVVSRGGKSGKAKERNTSNLWYHLYKEHRTLHDEAKRSDEAAVEEKRPKTTQQSLTEVIDKITKWDAGDPRAKRLDKMVMEMLATDTHAYNMVEGVGFKRLVAAMEPRYTLKTEKFFRTQKLHEVYDKVVIKIKELLSEKAGEHIAFTTDCWTGTTESMMSLTSHFITSEWERVQVILNVTAMTGSHTGQYICDLFLELLQKWDIDPGRVMLVLRDSGANVIKAMRVMEQPDLSCCAHTLQLVVQDALGSQRVVNDALAKLKRCATHFNHSVLAQQRLDEIQNQVGVPDHSILQATPTRWNSALAMLRRMLEQKPALTLYAADHGQITCPDADEWNIVGKLIKTLTPIEDITKEMSAENASISCIIPTVRVLRTYLEQLGEDTRGIQTFRSEMLNSLNKRFANMEKTREVLLACILDPRYKQRPLSDTATNRAKVWLKEEAEKVCSKPTTTASHSTEASRSTDSSTVGSSAAANSSVANSSTASTNREGLSQRQHLLDNLYDEMLLNQEAEPDEPGESLLEELERFWKEPVLDRKTGDPLQWWKCNSSRFLQLSPLARKFLTPPPTSVPSERVFSTMGNIYDDKRSALLGANAEKLCFLYYNLPLINWKY